MPKVTLPDGKVLVGPAADAYLAAQKKAEKEAKKALEAAKKSGDVAAACAAAAELASTKSSSNQSSSDAFQSATLDDVRSGSHGYRFYRITSAVDALSFNGSPCVSEETLKDGFAKNHYGSRSYETYVATVTADVVLEVHPDNMKKNGKASINISDGCIVAVKEGEGVVHKHAVNFAMSKCSKLQNVSVKHMYICAVIPSEMESLCNA
jgi:hypothetical protein